MFSKEIKSKPSQTSSKLLRGIDNKKSIDGLRTQPFAFRETTPWLPVSVLQEMT